MRRRPARPFAPSALREQGDPRPLGGEGVWIPLGDLQFGVGYENATSYPARGEIILYPGGVSETEILLAYGGVQFASKAGQLAGNHFITLTTGLEQLRPLGRKTLWEGAQTITLLARLSGARLETFSGLVPHRRLFVNRR